MMSARYRFVDCDSHYYEPDDCFTRHIDAKYREHAVNIQRGCDGLGRVHIGTSRLAFMSVTQTDWIGAPGSLRPLFDGTATSAQGTTETMTRSVIHPREHPPFMNRDARLQQMDAHNVHAAVMLPTLGVCVEHQLSDDVDACLANLRAFNRWIEDDWGYAFEERIFGVPLVSLLDLQQALAELDRVLEAGARLVHLTPGPVHGRSPADPHFDPFWSVVQEAGIPVVFHAGDCGYASLYANQWSEPSWIPMHRYSPLQHLLCVSARPASDTVAALVLHNLFGRFPRLKVVLLELGSDWIADLLKAMDKATRIRPGFETIGGRLTDEPSNLFREHFYVSPFHEENVPALAGVVGDDHVLFGSDYPHPEGVAAPADFLTCLDGLPEHSIRKVMRTNGAKLLGLE